MKLFSTIVLLAAATSSWAQGQTAQSSAPAGGETGAFSAFGPYIRLQSSSPGNNQPGNSHIAGTSMAASFVANNAAGSGVVSTGAEHGVVGYSSNWNGMGVYGENYPGFGVVGRSDWVAVWGDNMAGGVGVHGASVFGTMGRGVYGQGGYIGVHGSGTYGIVSSGTAYVAGDLVVTGSKTGYVVDLIRNGDGVPLAPGELVEIVGSEPAVLGDIPVAIVRRASSANARAVLGPISNALVLGPTLTEPAQQPARPEHLAPLENEDPSSSAIRSAAPGILRVPGAILPGGYGNVVTMGAFRAIKVDARFGAIHAGDLLVASPTPGFAMADADPETGTVIGKALASWSEGQGEIPVMVGMR